MSFQHPLDPLSHSEQELIVAHSRKAWNLQDHHLFAMLQLHEPTKAELSSGKKLDRIARVTIWDRKKARACRTSAACSRTAAGACGSATTASAWS